MNSAARRSELVLGPFRAARRAGMGWAIAFGVAIVGTVAFWPAFRESTAIGEALQGLPPSLIEAFGLRDFGSPGGYLRAGLYELMIPLMFASMGILLANASTAGEEERDGWTSTWRSPRPGARSSWGGRLRRAPGSSSSRSL